MRKNNELLSFIAITIVVFLISYAIGTIDSNIGSVFFVYTALSVTSIFAGVSSYIKYKKGLKGSISSIILVMIYLMFLFIPTVKLYSDIPNFLNGDLSITEGIVNEAVSSRGYLNVNLNEKDIQFWGTDVEYDDFITGSEMKIYYLPRSMQGVKYEVIKK